MLVQKGPTQSYLDKVKKQWIEQYKTNVKENNTWLNQILDYKLQGGDPKRFVDYEKFVEQVNRKRYPAGCETCTRMVKNQFTAVLMPENYGTKAY